MTPYCISCQSPEPLFLGFPAGIIIIGEMRKHGNPQRSFIALKRSKAFLRNSDPHHLLLYRCLVRCSLPLADEAAIPSCSCCKVVQLNANFLAPSRPALLGLIFRNETIRVLTSLVCKQSPSFLLPPIVVERNVNSFARRFSHHPSSLLLRWGEKLASTQPQRH